MRILKDLYQYIVRFGLDSHLSHFDQLRIKIINQFALFITIGTFLGGIISAFNQENDFYNSFIMMVAAVLMFLLMHKRWYSFARIYAMYLYPLLICYYVILYGSPLHLEFAFLCFILGGVFIYDKPWTRLVNTLYLVLLMIGSIYYTNNYSGKYEASVDFVDTILVLTVTIFCCYWLLNIYFNESKDQYLRKDLLIAELADKNGALKLSVEKNSGKNKLLTILAHDIKTPVNSFRDLSKKLHYLIKKKEYKRLMTLAESFETNGKNLLFSLDNLLIWVLSQKDGISVYNEKIELKSLLLDIISSHNNLIIKKGLSINLNVDPGIMLYSDRNMLRIIFNNVLNNAIKYCFDKSSIKIDGQIKNGFIRVIIFNNGRGMAQKEINSFLDHHELEKIENVKPGGHGLGLKTCVFLMNKIEGKIRIDSQPDDWIFVSLEFPAYKLLSSEEIKTKKSSLSKV